jgi:hypothetical protein
MFIHVLITAVGAIETTSRCLFSALDFHVIGRIFPPAFLAVNVTRLFVVALFDSDPGGWPPSFMIAVCDGHPALFSFSPRHQSFTREGERLVGDSAVLTWPPLGSAMQAILPDDFRRNRHVSTQGRHAAAHLPRRE